MNFAFRRGLCQAHFRVAPIGQSFDEARTYNEWSDEPVDEKTIRELYDHVKWGPTSANCSPARFVWVRSGEGKAKLAALAMEANRPKILTAPITVVVAHDLAFPETMPKLFPARGEMMRQFFFSGTTVKSNFICSIGHGKPARPILVTLV